MVALLEGHCRDLVFPILHQSSQERLRIHPRRLRQQRRHGPQQEGAAAEIFNLKSQALQVAPMRPDNHCGAGRELYATRQQRLLRRDVPLAKFGRQALKQHALVGRMLIDDLQFFSDLS